MFRLNATIALLVLGLLFAACDADRSPTLDGPPADSLPDAPPQLEISDEIPLGRPGPLDEFISSATAAFDGVNFRIALHHYYGPATVGLRLAPDGTRLDEAPTLVGASRSADAMSFDCLPDGNCLAGWVVDQLSGPVELARVDGNGATVDAPIVIGDEPAAPIIANDGVDWMVLLLETDRGIRLANTSPAPTVTPFTLPFTLGSSAAIQYGRGAYLVARRESGALKLLRLAPDGTPIDPAPATVAGPIDSDPALAFNGTSFLLAWARGIEIYAMLIASDGTLGDPFAITQLEGYPNLELASDGAGFLVLWSDPWSGLVATRISSDGAVLDPTPFLVSSFLPLGSLHGSATGLTFGGGNYLATWAAYISEPGVTGGARAARITPDGIVLDSPALILTTPQPLLFPNTAWGGDGFLVTWGKAFRDEGGHAVDGEAAMLAPSGNVTESVGLGITGLPSPAYDGTAFFVEVTSGTSSSIVRLGDDLGVLDAIEQSGRAGPIAGGDSSLARSLWLGDGSLAVQVIDTSDGISGFDPITIAGAATAYSPAPPVWDGTEYLIAWSQESPAGIFTERFGRNGQALGPPIQLSLADPAHMEALAAGTRSCLLVTSTDSDAGTVTLTATVLTPGGTEAVGDPVELATDLASALVTASFDGGYYVVAWSASDRDGPGRSEYSAWLAEDGTLLADPREIGDAALAPGQSLSCSPTGICALGYNHMDHETGVLRAVVRLLSSR